VPQAAGKYKILPAVWKISDRNNAEASDGVWLTETSWPKMLG